MSKTLHCIRINQRYDSPHPGACSFCGYPLSRGQQAFQLGEDGPLVCSRGCGVNLAAHREYLDSPGLDYLPGRDPGQVDGLPSESPEWFGPAESEVV